MATLNTKRIAILKNLVENGFTDEKSVSSIGLNEAAKLPRCCRLDLMGVLECIQAVKSGKLLTYLVEENGQEETDET